MDSEPPSRSRRASPPLTGILAIDKPQGWTSHDVVARVRRLAGQRQVGHAGTLDPLATGVLLIILGRATKLSSFLVDTVKEYRAVVVLGATTVTDDAEAPLKECSDVSGVSQLDIERCLLTFIGEIEQVPPMYAAVRQGGQKLYALARRGIEVRREPRRVRIHAIELEAWRPPCLHIRVRCAAGTYIRSLARDIGHALRVGGYLHALRRTASGTFAAAQALPLDRVETLVSEQGVSGLRMILEPPDRAVLQWPAIVVGQSERVAIRHGQGIRLDQPFSGNLRVYDMDGSLLALASGMGPVARPFLVVDHA